MSILGNRIIKFSIIGVILAALIVGNIIAAINDVVITRVLCGTGILFEGEEVDEALTTGDDLCQQLMEEGMVLLKNENNALPLDFPTASNVTMPINVFGWSATDAGFLLKGIGSGSSTIRDDAKVTLLDALADAGFDYNKNIISMYEAYRNDRPTGNNAISYTLIEPPMSSYSSDLISNAKTFSDTAIVVFSRNGGENLDTDIPSTQTKHNLPSDSGRTFLQTSTEEEALLDMVSNEFSKVIVILNTANIMHVDFLNDERVDAAFFVGLTGQSGTRAIADLLKGEINPSGKTSDIYTLIPEADPAWANREKKDSINHIQYVEDIYYGYKWYETADAEGLLDNPDFHGGKGYDSFVKYPFGYGLSYTEFEWTVDEVSVPSPLTKDSKIEIEMSVTNVGSVAGKDVIQVYYTPPYIKGGIEKAHVNLVEFTKTALINPGDSQYEIKLSFSAYDMASYDCYDKNNNQFKGYELDVGKYEIKLMKNSHEIADCDDAVIEFNLSSTIKFEEDPVSGEAVENRFTGSTAYAGVPIDGKTVGAELRYLSRNDFKGTFPSEQAQTPTANSIITDASNYLNTSYDQVSMPAFNEENNLRFVQIGDKDNDGNITNVRNATLSELNGNVPSGKALVLNEELIAELGTDYDNPKWQKVIDQLTTNEVRSFIASGGFGSIALGSVGKIITHDYDGPAGFNGTVLLNDGNWTAYPSETVIGCTFNQNLSFIMGLALGLEASSTGLSGWYAPGVNLHRTQYTARNFEYYGEDGVHSGKMAARVIRGAKANGLYCYIKHFALSEPGPNPRSLNTWVTEQNFRENYLRPFEIAVKEGEANAVMTAFNRVGAVWAGANYAMNVSILRDEWGFRGSLVTDYYTGGDEMGASKGIRAGNDLWLNPNSSSALSSSNATEMYCAKNAVKNVLYTYANTYNYAATFDWDGELAQYKATLGVRTIQPVFRWWIIMLVGVDVIIVAGMGFWVFRILKPKKSNRVNQTI